MIKNYLLIIAIFFLYSCESLNNSDRVKSRYSNVESLNDLIDQKNITEEESSIEDAINGDLARKVKLKNDKYHVGPIWLEFFSYLHTYSKQKIGM